MIAANSSGVGELAAGAHRELPLRPLDAPAGDLGVLARGSPRSTSCVVRPCAAMPQRIEPDAHRVAALAADEDRADAGQALEPLLEDAVGDVGQLEAGVAVAREREPDDRLRVDVDLRDDRIVRLARELAADARDRSRTSLAASSTSRFSSNSMVMTEPCSWLEEVIVLTPSRVASCSSRMSVISVSTTLGLAPR